MTWTESVANMVGLDFETTGVDVFADRIVTASFVTISPGNAPRVHEWLVNPGVDIPEQATAVHGVTNEQARAGVDPAKALTEIVDGLADAAAFGEQPAGQSIPVVAFNASYDLSLLRAECIRHGVEPPASVWPVIDPLVIDKKVDKFRKGKRNLAATCEFYGVRQDNAHQSTGDVLATLRLTWAMAKRANMTRDELCALYADRRYPGELASAWQRLGSMTLGELHSAQVAWYAEQSESFAQYLRGLANEARHRADVAADDEQRATAEQEAAELDARVDTVSTEWPIRGAR